MALGTASNGDSLEEYYALLIYLARCHLDPRLTRKFSVEDLVQETMLRAHRAWDQFQGQGRQQRKAWLRIILLHALATELAHIKDDVNLERPIHDAAEDSSFRLQEFCNEEQTTPGAHAVRNERALLLEEALQKLDERQRTAILLKHYHNWSHAQIAEHLQTTPPAVAGLLHRGRKELQENLSHLESDDGCALRELGSQ
jgi:RNA polymerase sigma-70 factor, ECF subfamily